MNFWTRFWIGVMTAMSLTVFLICYGALVLVGDVAWDYFTGNLSVERTGRGIWLQWMVLGAVYFYTWVARP